MYIYIKKIQFGKKLRNVRVSNVPNHILFECLYFILLMGQKNHIIIVVDSERQFRYYIVQPQRLRTNVLN